MIVEEFPASPPPELLARGMRHRPGFFYLDSGRPEEESRPGYSFIGFDPFLTWTAEGDRITVEDADGRREFRGDSLEHLRALMHRHRGEGGAEVPFCGGAVGYFGYEFGASGEGIRSSHVSDPAIPDARFGFYDGVVACDRASGKTFLIANPVGRRSAAEIFTGLRRAVREAIDQAGRAPDRVSEVKPAADDLRSNLTREEYVSRVGRIKEYIAAGDVYQVNLSQRFEVATSIEPYAIYERLRTLSPAPFGAYLDAGGFEILSSSPELFLRIDPAGRVLTRPIKGTRPRGRNEAEDRLLAAELSASEKDNAELLMIVDLERNDLGRVCRFGSVRVEDRRRIEAHPTVFHLVATVSGQLADGRDVFDALRSLLPGGSITGAPKIRAMQIIDELESCRRGVYTGAAGCLGFDGTCNLNIAIRTIICRDGFARFHVGGGIVADSDPEDEYRETLAKGRAMRAALLGEDLA